MSGIHADPTGKNLSGADLRSAVLTGANLSGANLSGADLRSAVLKGANTLGANFQGARGVENDSPSHTGGGISMSSSGSNITIGGSNSANVNVGGGSMFNVGRHVGGTVVCGSGQPPNLPTPALGTVARQSGWTVVGTRGGSRMILGPELSITIGGAPATPEDLVNGGRDVVIRSGGSTMTFGEIS